ncbi:hypothetical protein [Aureimonas psammosilenae]|uniref:hypothetical protein n=1 Tax=Aureimonas psammosilenae TaxID=2495496 RepID=UPI001260DBF0|nr:hypothetical protein [Aureimonas psammosilenae]
MADLGAVLRKTIDGLPNATPELRAKVYEKARAAILRQIENANPPLADEVVERRTAALEDAIESTEAHYAGVEALEAEPFAFDEPAAPPLPEPPVEPITPAAPIPRLPRVEDDFTTPPVAERRFERSTERREPALGLPADAPRTTEPDSGFDIPDADTSAPRYAASKPPRAKRSRAPLYAGVAGVALLALGIGGYLYSDRIPGFGTMDVASDNQTPAATGTENAALPSTGAEGENNAGTPDPSASAASGRRFTQRLLPDGTEVNDGPGAANSNAFDEGTNIAAATPEADATPATPAAPAATPPTASTPPASAPPSGAPAVAQRAMFYEERTDTQQSTQRIGNVVWSVVSEPPADDQPPEPAIRGVADVPDENFKLTLTIRRNLDQTLPASHVIELQFDVPPGFSGGQVANVQRLAMKPTEEARGEPLIGVAGKISDGFFIIALNNLDKATETNLSLLGKEQWIDIPLAYATGRRALMSIEKGVPGERVFKQAMDAWAAKT